MKTYVLLKVRTKTDGYLTGEVIDTTDASSRAVALRRFKETVDREELPRGPWFCLVMTRAQLKRRQARNTWEMIHG